MSGRGKGKSSKKAVSRSAKAGLQFPVGRIARYVLYRLHFITFDDDDDDDDDESAIWIMRFGKDDGLFLEWEDFEITSADLY